MESFQGFIDLRCPDNDLELFALAQAFYHIRWLIDNGGSDIGRQDDDSALYQHHLEVFFNRAVEITWENRYLAQEWQRLQQLLPQVKEAWERGQTLFQEAFEQTKSVKKDMKYFSIIDFAFDCYVEVTAACAYPDQPALRNRAINGHMQA